MRCQSPGCFPSGWLASSTSHPLHRSQNATLLEAEHCEQAGSGAKPRFLSRVATSVIKKVKKLSGGIDHYLLTTPNDILLYKKAIQIKKNIIRIHERAARPPHKPKLQGGASVRCERGRRAEVLPAEPPANAFPYRGPPRDSTMKPLPPHVVRALQEQQQQQ